MSFHQSFLFTLGIVLFNCSCTLTSFAQEDTAQQFQTVSINYLNKVSDKATGLNAKLDKQTTRALQQWQKQEARIKRKLAKTDSIKSAAIFGNAEQQYKQLEQKLQSKISLQKYIPSLDSMSSSLKFLQQNPQLIAGAKATKEKLSNAISKVGELENQFQKAEEVKKFLKERKKLLKEELGQLGFAKEFKKLSKQSYYYNQRLNEFQSLVKDHTKAERKALELLSKSKVFSDFMRKNSMLASLFRLPENQGDPATQASLAGLQTRASVNVLIQQQISAGGPGAQQQFSQNLQAAQSQLSELKDKALKLGNGNSDQEMPEGFKPSSQKTKSFFKRLEFGTNIQSQKANGFFPVTSDVGISLGYKLADRSTIGVGGSYKIGFGQSIRHIHITHQGISIRSFVDWKIKGSFWLSGGYERNYRPEIRTIEQLKDKNGWQSSGLLGLAKVVSMKTKFFKKMKLGLSWDFLSYQQLPKANAIIFRVGYNF